MLHNVCMLYLIHDDTIEVCIGMRYRCKSWMVFINYDAE